MSNFSLLQLLRTAVEIPTVFAFFAFSLGEVTTNNFIIYRSCYVKFGYNKSDCELLGTGDATDLTDQIEEEIQPFANTIYMVLQMVEMVAPALLVLFLGPLSDRYGRRPFLIMNSIGFTLAGIASTVVSSIDHASPWFLLGFSIPVALFGGILPFLSILICYVSDITSEETRGFRMGVFDAAMVSGMLIGTVSTSYIFKAGGYITSYSLIATCFFIPLLFFLLVMTDKRQSNKENRESKINVFSVNHFQEIFRTIFNRNNYHLSVIIVLAMISSGIIKFISLEDTVLYLYVRKELYWDMEKYTLYKTFRELLRVGVTVAGISLLHKKLKIREAPLILFSAILAFGSVFVQAWASKDWHIYLAGVIRSFSGVLVAITRTFLSKLVAQDETGKLFSATVVLESLVLLCGIPLYTVVYNNTLDSNPGTFNFVTGGLYLILILFATITMVLQKFSLKQHVLIERKAPVDEVKSKDVLK